MAKSSDKAFVFLASAFIVGSAVAYYTTTTPEQRAHYREAAAEQAKPAAVAKPVAAPVPEPEYRVAANSTAVTWYAFNGQRCMSLRDMQREFGGSALTPEQARQESINAGMPTGPMKSVYEGWAFPVQPYGNVNRTWMVYYPGKPTCDRALFAMRTTSND